MAVRRILSDGLFFCVLSYPVIRSRGPPAKKNKFQVLLYERHLFFQWVVREGKISETAVKSSS